ncbi:MAG: PorT family protein [Flavipsychrobacter sp.]|nr:PorT family protein [Flavipsychrobacter sp.]
MTKRLALAMLIAILPAVASAQNVEKSKDTKKVVQKPSRDFVMLQLTYNGWQNKPDSINLEGFNRGINGYICYDFPIGKSSHLSFAAGIGLSSSNYYFKNQRVVANDTGSAAVIRFHDTTGFKRSKMNVTYLQAPFELRYFGNKDNRNVGFKAAIGLQVGTLLGSHAKNNYTIQGTNVKALDKTSTKRFLNTWNFAATARVGWGNFSLFGSYNLTTLYKDLQGPPLTPYSFGICISGL